MCKRCAALTAVRCISWKRLGLTPVTVSARHDQAASVTRALLIVGDKAVPLRMSKLDG